MKQRGSAIVISMLLISAISLIAFGLAKAMYANTGTVTLYEDGSVAYYAAESGLEEGFLRYRYNQNTEVPFDKWTLGETKVFKSTIGSLDGTAPLATDMGDGTGTNLASNITKTNQAYDLRIGYLGTNGFPFFGVPDTNSKKLATSAPESDLTGEYGSIYVPQDESIKINLTGLNLNDSALTLKAQFYGVNGTSDSDKCHSLMEVKFIVKEAGTVKEYTDLTKPSSPLNCDTTNLSGINSFRTLSGTSVGANLLENTVFYTISPLQQVFTNALALPPVSESAEVVLTLRPLFHSASIGLVTAGCDGPVSSSCNSKTTVVAGPFTTVESTGYFGSVVKKLSANIDRQSGTLYDLFDYVINKNS